MRVFGCCIVALTLLVLGCASHVVKGDRVNISGVVVDEITGDLLNNVNVELYIFEQGSIFTMGVYKIRKKVEVTDKGEFYFTVEKGETVQIRTKTFGVQLYGGFKGFRKVSEDRLDVIVRHKSDR